MHSHVGDFVRALSGLDKCTTNLCKEQRPELTSGVCDRGAIQAKREEISQGGRICSNQPSPSEDVGAQ